MGDSKKVREQPMCAKHGLVLEELPLIKSTLICGLLSDPLA